MFLWFFKSARSVALSMLLVATAICATLSVARAGSNDHKAGDCPPQGSATCGDPIYLPTGNFFDQVVDFRTAGDNVLEFKRSYNSVTGGWTSRFSASLFISPSEVDATRPDGKVIYFVPDGGGGWKGFKNLDARLTKAGTTWTLTDWRDTVETYTEVGSGSFISARLESIKARNGYTQTLHYDAGQRLTSVSDSNGRTLTFAYNNLGQNTAITTPDGKTINYAYSLVGSFVLLTQVTYPTSPASSVTYLYDDPAAPGSAPSPLTGVIDENGVRYLTLTYDYTAGYSRATSSQHAGGADLTQVVYSVDGSFIPLATVTGPRGLQEIYTCPFIVVQGSVTLPTCRQVDRLATATTPAAVHKTTYDANGYIASETDWNGVRTQYANDARGNETSRTLAFGTPLAQTITTAWHPTLHLPTQISEPGRTTSFAYDANGNLLSKTITSANVASTRSWTYNALGQALTATDPLGHVSTFTYNGQGNLTTATNALGHVTQFTSYDANGRLLSVTDPNGVTTTFTYDFWGRVLTKTTLQQVTTYAYDPVGQLTKLTLPDGSFYAFTYDAARRLTRIADALGNRIQYTLDAAGNRTKEELFSPGNVLLQTRSFGWDSFDRLTQAIGALGQITGYAYDPQGNLTQITDPLGNATAVVHDALDRLASVTQPNGAVTGLGYDAKSRLASVTDARGLKTVYTSNGLDERLSITSPDAGLQTNTYDAAGNVLTSTDGNGKTTSYQYDALNRVVLKIHQGGGTTSYQYDQGTNGIGRLTSRTDVATTTWRYNRFGQVNRKTQTQNGVTLTTSWTYNQTTGQVATMTYPSGKVLSYFYDPAGRVAGVSLGAAPLVSALGWRPFGGPVVSLAFGNGASYGRAYDLDGRIASLTLPAGVAIGLAYDAAGRITGMTETGLPAKSFSYNKVNRLIGYAGGATTQSLNYDLAGNRVKLLQTGPSPASLTYSYDAVSNRVAGISGSSTETFAYDAAGNLTARVTPTGTTSFTYNQRNRPFQTTVGGVARQYRFSTDGERLAKFDPSSGATVLFLYDLSGHLLGRYDGAGNAMDENVWLGDLPVALLTPSATYYVAPDHLGAPHQITDAGKNVVWLWDHDPFGNGAPTGSLVYNLRFPGQFFDAQTGLHYNYFRDYDPRTGRYIESDPIGLEGGLNTYAYVEGNPLSRVDPMGLQPDSKKSPLTKIDDALGKMSKDFPPFFPTLQGLTSFSTIRIGPVAGALAATFLPTINYAIYGNANPVNLKKTPICRVRLNDPSPFPPLPEPSDTPPLAPFIYQPPPPKL